MYFILFSWSDCHDSDTFIVVALVVPGDTGTMIPDVNIIRHYNRPNFKSSWFVERIHSYSLALFIFVFFYL